MWMLVENHSEQKAALRKKLRSLQREMPKFERDFVDAAICRSVLKLPLLQQKNVVFCYIGVDWEINTVPLIYDLLRLKKRVVLPLCTSPGIMEAREITGAYDLVPGAYNIPEPRASCPLCPPEQIDLALIPCVSCDRQFGRLGQGGGFYDRFLENADFFTVALCREKAMLDEVPTESWDQSVDCIVTDKNTYFRKSLN